MDSVSVRTPEVFQLARRARDEIPTKLLPQNYPRTAKRQRRVERDGDLRNELRLVSLKRHDLRYLAGAHKSGNISQATCISSSAKDASLSTMH